MLEQTAHPVPKIEVSLLICARLLKQRATVLLNRPGFTGDIFVQESGDFIKGVQVCIEGVLHFLRRAMPDGSV